MGCNQSAAIKPAERAAKGHVGSMTTLLATERDGQEEKAAKPFALHAMRMGDFLALERLMSHNELVAKGLVMPLDFEGEHAGATLNFISQYASQLESQSQADGASHRRHTGR